MAADTADTSDTAPQRPDGAPQKTGGSTETLVALTGDTYPLRAQLKAMGAVWDSAGRVWKIASERAAQAQALVDHRPAVVGTASSPAAAPPAAVRGSNEAARNGAAADETDPLADLPDPFEESEPSIPPVALSGNTYPVKEALKALGAHWDKEQRAWLIVASKAAHAQAIVDNQQNEAPGEA